MDYSGWAMGLSSLIGVATKVSDIKSQTSNVLKAIDLESDSYLTQYNILTEQSNEIDRELGDAMTQRGLDALKAEARLRAGAAETGTSGGTTRLAYTEAYVTQALDNAILKSRSEQTKRDLVRRKIMTKISYTNRMNSLTSGIQSGTSAGLEVFSTGMSSAISGYQMGTMFNKIDFGDKNVG